MTRRRAPLSDRTARVALLALVSLGGCSGSSPGPPPAASAASLEVRPVAVAGAQSVRLVRDPVSNDLFVLRREGSVVRLGGLDRETATVEIAATPDVTGVAAPQGMAFGPDGSLCLAPYVFAHGVRNTFDLAWNAAGDLFGAENSGDREDPDELNWIREGGHYGFPWRMGTNDTPQQFPG